MISCACTACGRNFRVKDDAVGKKAKCRECGQFFVVAAMPQQGVESRPTSIPNVVTTGAESKVSDVDPADRSQAEFQSRRTVSRRNRVLAAAALAILSLILGAFFLRKTPNSAPLSTSEPGSSSPDAVVGKDNAAHRLGGLPRAAPASQTNSVEAITTAQEKRLPEQTSQESARVAPTTAGADDTKPKSKVDSVVDPITLKFPPRSGKLALIDFRKAMDSKGYSYGSASAVPLNFATSIREFVSSMSDAERKQTYVLRNLDAAAVQPESLLTLGMMPPDTSGLTGDVTVPDEMEAYVRSVVPLRLLNPAFEYNNSEAEGVAKFAAAFSLCKADVKRSLPWFLTKDKKLSPCRGLVDISVVLRSRGLLYLPQSRDETMVFAVSTFDGPFKRELREYKIHLTMDVAFDEVQLEKPVDVGLYNLKALLKARCNSDELDHWNLTGGFLNDDPDLFRPVDAVSRQAATAQLLAVFLYDDRHNVVAAYRLPNDKRVLEFPPTVPEPKAEPVARTMAKATGGGTAQPATSASRKVSRTHKKTSKQKVTSDREKHSQQFLSWVTGQWRLQSQEGQTSESETIRIDQKGNYFVVQDGHERLAFVLRNIEHDPPSSTVTFAKAPSGSAGKSVGRRVEILEINESASTMSGHVKNGGTTLSYTRIAADSVRSK